MKVMVIGRGGREHVLSRHLLQSDLVETVYCLPGNPGMALDGIECVNIPETDHDALISFAKDHDVKWALVGPEVPLINGIVDDFEAAGVPAFGPHRSAASIEGSKEFAKELMVKTGIPTATYKSFTDFERAKQYILEEGAPIVIKADGLAAGKGVVVALTDDEAISAAQDMLEGNRFGDAGATVVIEEFLEGEEFSQLAFVRGESVYPMVIAQDHKRAYDDDRGPNTGGMGAYSPVPHIPQNMVEEAIARVLIPAAKGMVEQGTPFTGILYAGLIATQDGPKVIEFNARFGDPEAQVVLPRLKSDLAEIIDDLLEGREPQIEWDNNGAELGVVVAADGYPGDYLKGVTVPQIEGDVTVDYAGVSLGQNGELVSDGGRVYLVKASGATLQEAQQKVYASLVGADTGGTFYRKDIGNKALD